MNQRVRRDSKTGIPGVTLRKEKNLFQVHIMLNKKKKYLGTYKTLDEAKQVRSRAEKDVYGEFARQK